MLSPPAKYEWPPSPVDGPPPPGTILARSLLAVLILKLDIEGKLEAGEFEAQEESVDLQDDKYPGVRPVSLPPPLGLSPKSQTNRNYLETEI